MSAIDDNQAAKTALEFALGEIPVAGDFLDVIVEVFWPSDATNPMEVWDSVRQWPTSKRPSSPTTRATRVVGVRRSSSSPT